MIADTPMMMAQLRELVVTFPSHACDTLFDPVQTHVIHGVTEEDLDLFKQKLKEDFNAIRFRAVKCKSDRWNKSTFSLCFKLK